MCEVEDAIKTVAGSVLVSKEVYKKLVEEYEKHHGEEETTLMMDEKGRCGCATEGEILIILEGIKEQEELTEKYKKLSIEWHYTEYEDFPKPKTKVVTQDNKGEIHILWLDDNREWHCDEEDYEDYEDYEDCVGYDSDYVVAWYYPKVIENG